MKPIGRFLQFISTLLVLTYGLHLFAVLLRTLHLAMPTWLYWFWHLPLPHNPMDWRAGWPMLVGVAGTALGTWLVERTKRAEKMRLEESEA